MRTILKDELYKMASRKIVWFGLFLLAKMGVDGAYPPVHTRDRSVVVPGMDDGGRAASVPVLVPAARAEERPVA